MKDRDMNRDMDITRVVANAYEFHVEVIVKRFLEFNIYMQIQNGKLD